MMFFQEYFLPWRTDVQISTLYIQLMYMVQLYTLIGTKYWKTQKSFNSNKGGHFVVIIFLIVLPLVNIILVLQIGDLRYQTCPNLWLDGSLRSLKVHHWLPLDTPDTHFLVGDSRGYKFKIYFLVFFPLCVDAGLKI